MLSTEFSVFIMGLCLVLAVVFFLGKGEGIISMFGGRNAPVGKKRTAEEERRYQRAFGIFCLVIALAEIPMILFNGDEASIGGILSIVIVVADFVWVTLYLKKNFPDG